jgi:ribonucleoside-diphosphate reductase alpha chain
VEPDIALVKYKKLVGGGMLKYVNRTVPQALRKLGYDKHELQDILDYIDVQETIEGAPHLREEHLSVFDCAFKPRNGTRSIEPLGHIRMMGAVQSFISGAISKTINLPTEATVEDIEEAYIHAWRLGLKAVAVYRDGCKRAQPLNTGAKAESSGKQEVQPPLPVGPVRRRLPGDCSSYRHKFDVAGHEGYIHVGFYDDGTPGEIFIKMAKEGSTISGLMDTIATLTSLALQYGVPLEALVKKFEHVRFEPSGFTQNPDIPVAKSLTDYIFRFLGIRFLRERLAGEDVIPAPKAGSGEAPAPKSVPRASVTLHGRSPGAQERSDINGHDRSLEFILPQADAPTCQECGTIMVRNGACYKCLNCGATSGCS